MSEKDDLNAEFHQKMADAADRGLRYDPNDPASLEGKSARLIKEGEELMALDKAREEARRASMNKWQLLVERLKGFVGLG